MTVTALHAHTAPSSATSSPELPRRLGHRGSHVGTVSSSPSATGRDAGRRIAPRHPRASARAELSRTPPACGSVEFMLVRVTRLWNMAARRVARALRTAWGAVGFRPVTAVQDLTRQDYTELSVSLASGWMPPDRLDNMNAQDRTSS